VEPQPGDLFVTKTGGRVAAIIRWATGHATGDFWHRQPALVNHGGVFVGRRTFTYQGRSYVNEPAVVEGRPGGAGLAPLSIYKDAVWSTDVLPLDPDNGACNVAVALRMIGTRYGWLNCACIGLVKVFGWHVPPPVLWILKSRRWAECAQLCDFIWTDGAALCARAYGKAGRILFDDGRPAGLVSPEDLLDLMQATKPAPTL